MQTIHISMTSRPAAVPPSVATIGFFDGVHRGHRFLLDHVIAEARAEGLASMAVTFDRHPRQVLHSDYVPQALSTPEEKLRLLAATGIDCAAVLHFDRDMAACGARDFMRDILRDGLGVRRLVIGYDHRFGHNRAEGFDDYVRYGRELGIVVEQAPAFSEGGDKVSSSLVRRLLAAGDVERAAECLGRPYAVSGKVVGGYREGRRMGFPTANLDVAGSGRMLPADGVYATEVHVGGEKSALRGMTNIGRRPTFGTHGVTVETYILDYSADLYGREMSLAFRSRLRGEHTFSSPGELAAQLAEDREEVRKVFGEEKVESDNPKGRNVSQER